MATNINTRMVAPQTPKSDLSSVAKTVKQDVSKVAGAVSGEASKVAGAVSKGLSSVFGKDSFEAPKASTKAASFTPDNDGFVLKTKNGKTAGTGTTASSPTDLKYFGGGVLDKPEVTNMYIGDYFKTSQGQADVQHNDAFMADYVQNKDTTSIWHQYGVDSGTTQQSQVLGGKFKSNATITQKQIEQMLQTAVANGTVKPGAQSIYNFVLPPGATLKMDDGTSSKQGLGGFHSSIKTPDGQEVFYSAIAYSQGRNGIDFTGGNAQDNISITESHEISEAVTDPHVQDAINDNNNAELGWTDPNNGEVGDIEVNDAAPGTPLSSMYGRSDGYAVQKIWSQVDQTNEISAVNPGPVQPLPTPAAG